MDDTCETQPFAGLSRIARRSLPCVQPTGRAGVRAAPSGERHAPRAARVQRVPSLQVARECVPSHLVSAARRGRRGYSACRAYRSRGSACRAIWRAPRAEGGAGTARAEPTGRAGVRAEPSGERHAPRAARVQRVPSQQVARDATRTNEVKSNIAR